MALLHHQELLEQVVVAVEEGEEVVVVMVAVAAAVAQGLEVVAEGLREGEGEEGGVVVVASVSHNLLLL